MKKTFEMPIVTVEKFEKEDILTLSVKDSGNVPSIKW